MGAGGRGVLALQPGDVVTVVGHRGQPRGLPAMQGGIEGQQLL